MSDLETLVSSLTSGEDDRAESAAVALAKIGETALPSLLRLLGSQDSDQRWWAVRTIAGMGRPWTDVLTGRLGDEAAEVRAAAALALATHPTGAAVPELVRRLGDEDNLVSTLCVNALVALGSACVPALLEAFEAEGPRGRIQIMRALSALKDPQATAVMLKATEEDSAMLAYWAREGLDALGLSMVYMIPE